MDKPKTTPKDFFLWAGAMVSLYASIVAFITLFFNYIDYAFPTVVRDSYYYSSDPYQGGISYAMATLIVLTPIFLVLMRLIRRDIERDPSRRDIWIRRWALFLTLFVAGITIAIDLITLLYTFLSGGDITTAFLLKVLVVLLVAGASFMHFLADLWGFWVEYPSRAKMVGYGVGALVIVSIVSGFFIIGTPGQARQYRLDEQRVSDLQSLQSQVLSFYQQKQLLPNTLKQLEDPTLYYSVPVDPETGALYEYKKTADLGFELCATFTAESRTSAAARALTKPVSYGVSGDTDWKHGVGHTCFTRSIDPDFFPPIKR